MCKGLQAQRSMVGALCCGPESRCAGVGRCIGVGKKGGITLWGPLYAVLRHLNIMVEVMCCHSRK